MFVETTSLLSTGMTTYGTQHGQPVIAILDVNILSNGVRDYPHTFFVTRITRNPTGSSAEALSLRLCSNLAVQLRLGSDTYLPAIVCPLRLVRGSLVEFYVRILPNRSLTYPTQVAFLYADIAVTRSASHSVCDDVLPIWTIPNHEKTCDHVYSYTQWLTHRWARDYPGPLSLPLPLPRPLSSSWKHVVVDCCAVSCMPHTWPSTYEYCYARPTEDAFKVGDRLILYDTQDFVVGQGVICSMVRVEGAWVEIRITELSYELLPVRSPGFVLMYFMQPVPSQDVRGHRLRTTCAGTAGWLWRFCTKCFSWLVPLFPTQTRTSIPRSYKDWRLASLIREHTVGF